MRDTYCYYVFKHVYMGEKINLPFGIKIWKYKSNLPLLHFDNKCYQGPFLSLEILEKTSSIIQDLKEKYNRDQYKVLFDDKNILELSDIILMPPNKSYSLDLVNMITHGTQGVINRNISTGGHFLDKNKVRISKLIDTDSKGVIKAKIEIFDFKKEKWISKKAITTLFPETWSLQKYANECRYCIENNYHVDGDYYKATTKCGIETTLIIENNKVITFYPNFEK